jgi:hypothetical protein
MDYDAAFEKLIGHVGLTLELSGHINREAIDWSA